MNEPEQSFFALIPRAQEKEKSLWLCLNLEPRNGPTNLNKPKTCPLFFKETG